MSKSNVTPVYQSLVMPACQLIFVALPTWTHLLVEGVMVIVVRNGHNDPSSNPRRSWVTFYIALTLLGNVTLV